METTQSIGRVLKILRIANAYTTSEIASLAQVSHAYISQTENGKKTIGRNILRKFSELYNVSADQTMDLVRYYESLALEENRKYQLTLLRALEILLNNSKNKAERSKNINQVLKIARYANNITIETASEISGVSMVYISELECGKNENICDKYLEKLSNAYKMKVPQVMDLVQYYETLYADDERKFRLTLIKVLEIIDSNQQ